MKLLSWNVRGLGKPRTRLALKKILHLHRPQIFFCCETKLLARQVESVCRDFNFENCFAVDRTGMGGGLALIWRAEVNVSITSYSSHHIDALVCSESGLRWRCTGIYGHPELSQKHNTWTLMKRLASLFSYPWCCFGDFNEIMHMHEKNGAMRETWIGLPSLGKLCKAAICRIWGVRDIPIRGQTKDTEIILLRRDWTIFCVVKIGGLIFKNL